MYIKDPKNPGKLNKPKTGLDLMPGAPMELKPAKKEYPELGHLVACLFQLKVKAQLVNLNKTSYQKFDYKEFCEELDEGLEQLNKVVQRIHGCIKVDLELEDLDHSSFMNCLVDCYEEVNKCFEKHYKAPCLAGPLCEIQEALACARYQDGERAPKYQTMSFDVNDLLD